MMDTLGRVDIVIPVYNGAKWIARATDSALTQSGVDVSVYVVDDGSSDDSLAIARGIEASDPRVHVIAAAHAGLSAARNTGIRAGASAWVALLDCDDTWNPLKCATQIGRCVEEGRQWSVCAATLVDEDGAALGQLKVASTVTLESLLEENTVTSPSGVLAARAMYELAGDFDESLSSAEDWDMWIRLAQHAEPAVVLEPMVNYTVHANNMSKDVQRMLTATTAVLEKHRALYGDRAFRRAVARNFVRCGVEAIAAGRVREALPLALRGFLVLPPAKGAAQLLKWCLLRGVRDAARAA